MNDFSHTYNAKGQIVLSFDEYMEIVQRCETIDRNARDPHFQESRMKFTHFGLFPSVEELKKYDVEDHFSEMLPYLIYYLEVYTTDDPEFKKTEKYLKELFARKLVITD